MGVCCIPTQATSSALDSDEKLPQKPAHVDGRKPPHAGNEQASLRRLLQMNAVVAAAAGVLKDYAEESGGTRVQSRILAHPHFERLEAEGAALGYASRLRRMLRRQPGF